MRIRSAWLTPALIAGITLAVPQGQALAATTAPTRPTIMTGRAHTVVLPTGDLVHLSGAPGHEHVALQPTASTGIAAALVTHRLRSHTYVVPAMAEPYLGRFLDPSLFDVTTLSTAKNTRIPVRMSYTGKAPTVPGVHLTSAAAGTARGYLTPASSATFGHALAQQWTADRKAGWPARKSLFPGVTKLSADTTVSPPITPAYAMLTLNVKVTGPDGKPAPYADLILSNTDDQRRYASYVYADAEGRAKVSVPKGNYTAISQWWTTDDDGATFTARSVSITDYQVSKAEQTLTADYRKATVEPAVSAPVPTTLDAHAFTWGRQDAARNPSIITGYFVNSTVKLKLSPAKPAAVGTLTTAHEWQLTDPATRATYDVATSSDRIPSTTHYRFASSDLASVKATYYGDGTPGDAGTTRWVSYGDAESASRFRPVARGTVRTEYVAATGKPTWTDSASEHVYDNLDYDFVPFDDHGFITGQPRTIAAGSTDKASWFRGPLVPAVPAQTGAGDCYVCRSGNTISFAVAPFTDSDPTHAGDMSPGRNGLPVARFRVYRNGKLLSDENDALDRTFTAPAVKSTYTVVADVDRRQTQPGQSTQSSTTWTFASAKNTGKKLPASWTCSAGPGCRVLPLLQARVALSTDRQGTVVAGKTTVTLSLAQVQKATTSPITSATLEWRPTGYVLHRPVTLTALGHGQYRGVIDTSGYPAGGKVDLFVTGKDKAGSTISQTIANAYTVKAS